MSSGVRETALHDSNWTFFWIGAAITVPLALVFPWMLLFLAPTLLAFGGFAAFGSRVERDARDPGEPHVQFLEVRGLKAHPELEAAFKAKALEVFGKDGKRPSDAALCACVKADHDRGGYLGVLRMRTPDGHTYAKVQGDTVPEIAQRWLEELDGYKGWVRVRPRAVENETCNEEICHLDKTIFEVETMRIGKHEHVKI
jgi:hypothetical protein